MTLSFRERAYLFALLCSAGACASTYDSDLLERRSDAFWAPRERDGHVDWTEPRATHSGDSKATDASERVLGAAASEESANETRAPIAGDPQAGDRDLRLVEPTPRGSDPADYVVFGLAHSASLRAAFERWRAATERVAVVSALPEPRLGYGEFLEEIQTRTGPQERRLSLSQAFPWPGELDARAEVERRRAEVLWRAVEGERLRVAARIESGYHELGWLGRELALTRRLLDLLRGLEPVVQGRVRAGGRQEDLLRLQVEVGRVEDELASLESRRPELVARLAAALNWPAAPRDLPLPMLAEPVVRAADVEALWASALEHNPRLAGLEEEWAASRAAEDLAGYRRRPNFSVGLDWIQTARARDPEPPGSGDDPLVLSLGVSLPVWTKSYAATERAARHDVLRARQELDAAGNELRAELERDVFTVNDAARRMRLFSDSLMPRAEEALELTLASYRTGRASILDLIDTERALLEFERSYWRACRDYLQADARLRATTGGDR